jgi:hypothetical protein
MKLIYENEDSVVFTLAGGDICVISKQWYSFVPEKFEANSFVIGNIFSEDKKIITVYAGSEIHYLVNNFLGE